MKKVRRTRRGHSARSSLPHGPRTDGTVRPMRYLNSIRMARPLQGPICPLSPVCHAGESAQDLEATEKVIRALPPASQAAHRHANGSQSKRGSMLAMTTRYTQWSSSVWSISAVVRRVRGKDKKRTILAQVLTGLIPGIRESRATATESSLIIRAETTRPYSES